MSWKSVGALAIAIITVWMIVQRRGSHEPVVTATVREGAPVLTAEVPAEKVITKKQRLPSPAAIQTRIISQPRNSQSKEPIVPPGHIARGFTVDEDHVAVVDGDIAIGLPPPDRDEGLAAIPVLQTWPTRRNSLLRAGRNNSARKNSRSHSDVQ